MYRVPTDKPEADGTFQWDATTVLVVEALADGGQRAFTGASRRLSQSERPCGLGFSYCAAAAAGVVAELLAPAVVGCSVDDVRAAWSRMVAAVRNIGRPGIAATAISAVDIAVWDLRAKLAGMPLFRLLGARREAVPIYASGGFTSYSDAELTDQLAGWV
ncbi:MAG TPA: hypothetical protein VFA49_00580, partial [Chloroflexota bacterium]|nr:hypothetical protein [Chloroflexota bacterium]